MALHHPARLLTWRLLLSTTTTTLLCRQQAQGLLPPGTAFDLFRGTAASARDEVEAYPTALAGKVVFGAKTHPEVRGSSQGGLHASCCCMACCFLRCGMVV